MSQPQGTKVLVSAGSKHGSTVEIAERIGSILRARGCEVDISRPEQVVGLEDYEAVVLGSAVYAGHWVDSAKGLAQRLADLSPKIPIWLFSSGPIGDPPKPEEDPVDVADILQSTGARQHRVFSGKIDKSKLNFAERAILLAVHGQEGDFRNWSDIEEWADEIAQRLVKEVTDR